MAQYKLIIYDLDGTLVDTREDISRAANYMLVQMGRPALSRPQIEKFVGKGLQYLIEGCLQSKDPKQVERGAKYYRSHYVEHMLDHSALYPEVKTVLETFRDRYQAVVTNKPDPYSTQILEALGVGGYFRDIIAGNSSFRKKPDPDAIFALMEKAGAETAETVFIGDSPIDIDTGRNAGVRTITLPQGFSSVEDLISAKAEQIVESFEALLKLAKDEAW